MSPSEPCCAPEEFERMHGYRTRNSKGLFLNGYSHTTSFPTPIPQDNQSYVVPAKVNYTADTGHWDLRGVMQVSLNKISEWSSLLDPEWEKKTAILVRQNIARLCVIVCVVFPEYDTNSMFSSSSERASNKQETCTY